jgi:hypothetical protein
LDESGRHIVSICEGAFFWPAVISSDRATPKFIMTTTAEQALPPTRPQDLEGLLTVFLPPSCSCMRVSKRRDSIYSQGARRYV